MPRKHVTVLKVLDPEGATHLDTKRKAPDEDTTMTTDEVNDDAIPADPSKRQKTNGTAVPNGDQPPSTATADTMLQSARAAAAFIPFLSPDELMPPKLPSPEEIEGVLLGLRKQALVQEYFGE